MCLAPLRATQCPDTSKVSLNSEGDFHIPCQKCIECRKKHSYEWATRCSHELSLYKKNTFITLTYNENSLPADKDEMQQHIKTFQNSIRRVSDVRPKFFYSVEYGSKNQRPHFHMIIFGHDFQDQILQRTTPKGNKLYTSIHLEKLWKHGFHSIGEANVKTSYYIASYALKNLTQYDTGTGEELKDYLRVSTRPAIGLDYFKRHAEQLILNGESLPRYYKKKLKDPKFFYSQYTDYDLLQYYEDNIKPIYRTPYQMRASLKNQFPQNSACLLRQPNVKSPTQTYIENQLDEIYYQGEHYDY